MHVMCVYIPKIHDDERRPTARAQTYKSHKYDGTRTIVSTDDTQKDTQHTHQIHDGTRTIASTDLQKDTKYDGTRTIESSDIQKGTKYTHTKYMIEGKTTKSTYTKRRQIRWNENYNEHIHKKTPNTLWKEYYRGYKYKKDIKIRWDENDTQRAQTHTHTLKRHTFYTCQRFFVLANVLRCFDARARKKIAL